MGSISAAAGMTDEPLNDPPSAAHPEEALPTSLHYYTEGCTRASECVGVGNVRCVCMSMSTLILIKINVGIDVDIAKQCTGVLSSSHHRLTRLVIHKNSWQTCLDA